MKKLVLFLFCVFIISSCKDEKSCNCPENFYNEYPNAENLIISLKVGNKWKYKLSENYLLSDGKYFILDSIKSIEMLNYTFGLYGKTRGQTLFYTSEINGYDYCTAIIYDKIALGYKSGNVELYVFLPIILNDSLIGNKYYLSYNGTNEYEYLGKFNIQANNINYDNCHCFSWAIFKLYFKEGIGLIKATREVNSNINTDIELLEFIKGDL